MGNLVELILGILTVVIVLALAAAGITINKPQIQERINDIEKNLRKRPARDIVHDLANHARVDAVINTGRTGFIDRVRDILKRRGKGPDGGDPGGGG